MKMKNVQMHNIKNLPDHIGQEVENASLKMLEALAPIVGDLHANIAFGAIGFVHASIIKYLVSNDPEELDKAIQNAAISLIKNVELLKNISSKKETNHG